MSRLPLTSRAIHPIQKGNLINAVVLTISLMVTLGLLQVPVAIALITAALGRVLILKERLSLIDFLWDYATLLNRGGVLP